MLVFEKFRVRNAYPFKHIDLDFRRQGLVRVAGPNGAGKSSVFNLFTQCALGTNPSTAKKADLILDGDDFLLEITFQKNGSQYVAAQSVKCKEKTPVGSPYGTGVYLFRDGVNISMHRDPDTQKLIKETLGWSTEEWQGYVFLQQSTTHTLINGTRSERQNYLSALFNLQPLDILASYFKKRSEDLLEKVAQIERDKQELSIKDQLYTVLLVKKIQEEYDQAVEMLELLSGKIKKLTEDQQRYRMRQSLEEKLSRLTPDAESIENLQTLLSDAEAQQTGRSASLSLVAQYEKSLNSLTPVADPVMPEGWKEEYAGSPDLDEKKEQVELSRLIQLEATLKPVPSVQIPQDLDEVLGSHDINLNQIKRQILEIESRPAPPTYPKPTPEQLTACRETKSEVSYKILNLKTEVQRLTFNEQTCDKCGTTLNCSDREQQLALKQEQLSELSDELTVVTSKLSTREKQAAEWAKYEALGPDRSGELPEMKASVSLYEKKLTYLKIRSDKQAYDLYEKNRTEVSVMPEIKERLRIWKMKQAVKAIAEQRQKRDDYLREQKTLQENIAQVVIPADMRQEIIALKSRINATTAYQAAQVELAGFLDAEDKSEKIQTLTAERDEVNSSLGGLKVQLNDFKILQGQITALQKSIASQEQTVRDQKRYALLAKGYGKAGVLRERQLARFSSYLEEALLAHTSRQLPEHSFQIKVDDGIDILACYRGKDKPATEPYDVKFMSGGEKGALSVAFLFALDDLLPPSRRTSLKILDEVEAAFDAERQQDFIAYTLPKLRERAETIVVISHSHAAGSGTFDKEWRIENGTIKETGEGRQFEDAG